MMIKAIPGTDSWQVRGEWYGQNVILFEGDLFDCLIWVKENSK